MVDPLCRDEFERDAIHAVAKSCRRRPIIENVAQMACASGAVNLGSRHAEIIVR
jgi:hypothetical protein